RPGSIDTEQKVETAPPQDVAVSQTGSDDAITAERNALQESAPNTVSDDASLRESVPESQIDTAPRSISGEPRGAPDVRESPIETALASVSSEPAGLKMFANRQSRRLRYRWPRNREKKRRSLQSLLSLLCHRSFFRVSFWPCCRCGTARCL